MKTLYKILTSGAILYATVAFSQAAKADNVLDLKYSIEDSDIVFPQSFETDTQKLLERWYLKNYTSADIKSTSKNDPGATDDQIRARLAALPTVIELPYNSVVKSYIERYTKKGRAQVTALLGLSSYYFPIFEQALEQNGLPLELKYLAVIESGLNPNAVSRHGATGLWQFILSAARGYDMEVNSLVDERRDPYLSTERACRFLKDLYATYGDWSLAIAAYNCGPGTVNKALARAGGDPKNHDFWSIYNYLPTETRGYVPMFIAANYVMNYYPEHEIAPVLVTKPLITDTICIHDRVHFNQISAVLDIPVEELRILNPQYRADIIPGNGARRCNLILPSQQIHAYIVSEEQILNYKREEYAQRIDATPGENSNFNLPEDETSGDEQLIIAQEVTDREPMVVQTDYLEVTPDVQQTTTPRRRRTETNPQGSTVTTTAATTPVSASTTTSAAPKKTNTTTSASTATTKKTNTTAAITTKKAANNTTASNSTKNDAKKNTKKKDTKKKEAAKPKDHEVANGENLTLIAKKHGVSVEDLKKANPKINPDKIHPGDKINLPKSSAKTDSKSSKANTTATTKKKKK